MSRATGTGPKIPPGARSRAARPPTDEIEHAPRAVLDAAALERLREMLDVASALPFYRGRFADAGVDPGAIDGFDTFATHVPTFRKADLIAALKSGGGCNTGIEALTDGTPVALVLTSGTLGYPTFASLGTGEFEHGSPYEVLREFRMNGMREGMRVLCMCPAWHHLAILDARALELLGAECIVPWGTFVPRFAPRALDLIRERRPEYLLTVTMMLHAMIEEARRRGDDPAEAFQSVRYALVVGEPVTDGQRRALVEELGLDDLFERGGSSDGLWGGADCPAHAGHHVWLDHHYVEVIDPESGRVLPPGERGSVIVTNLTLDRSLYIRFDTEDLGEILPGDCPCGRAHPRVELYGRLADCVRVRGKLVAPYDVRAALDEIPGLVGLPLLLGRRADDEESLRVYLDGEGRAAGLAEQATARLTEALGLPVAVNWTGPLPKRWKARKITEKTDKELAWQRR